MYLNKFFILLLIMVVFLAGACNKQTSEPEQLPSISIQLSDETGIHDGSRLYIAESLLPDDSTLKKNLNTESVEQVMVMILDFSMYDSSEQYFDSPDYKEFTKIRDGLTQQGKLTQWAEWEKLLGDYFRIVADQNLNIDGHHATGVVAGAVGLNYICVGMLGHGIIQYWYEGEVVAKTGETVRAYL
ncbi:hypothetical protein JXQ31_15080 [candidate division KSB1 bacterium]|nr:hypothetical protein [candidate division KSB1 bacterium]